MSTQLAAVVLAGGTARRLGGVDKASLTYLGQPLLEHALATLTGIDPVVVVGPSRPTSRPVRFTVEEPPSGGPVAGLLAGVAALDLPVRSVVVLAVDMPEVGSGTVARLVNAATGHDGAFLTDGASRYHLAGCLQYDALVGAGEQRNRSLRSFLAELDIAGVRAVGREAQDVDTWADLGRDRRPVRETLDPDAG